MKACSTRPGSCSLASPAKDRRYRPKLFKINGKCFRPVQRDRNRATLVLRVLPAVVRVMTITAFPVAIEHHTSGLEGEMLQHQERRRELARRLPGEVHERGRSACGRPMRLPGMDSIRLWNSVNSRER